MYSTIAFAPPSMASSLYTLDFLVIVMRSKTSERTWFMNCCMLKRR